MQTVNLKVEDSFYPHFKAMLESFIRDKKVELIQNEFPSELVVKSAEEVRKRAQEAEERIKNGEYLTEQEYHAEIDSFLKTL